MTKDRVTGLLALILGVTIAVSASQLPASTMAGDIGPKVFPYISAGILLLCGAGLCITGGKKAPAYYTGEQLKRLVLIFAVVAGYVVMMHFLGYRIATFAELAILCVMFSKGKNIAKWKLLLFSVVLTVVLYLVFTSVFKVPLPVGKLF